MPPAVSPASATVPVYLFSNLLLNTSHSSEDFSICKLYNFISVAYLLSRKIKIEKHHGRNYVNKKLSVGMH